MYWPVSLCLVNAIGYSMTRRGISLSTTAHMVMSLQAPNATFLLHAEILVGDAVEIGEIWHAAIIADCAPSVA